MTDYYRGHKIECINDVWRYADNGNLVSDNYRKWCGYCGKENTEEGYDGCIGAIPGAINACCGHGNEDEAYIQYEHSRTEGRQAIQEMQNLIRD